MSRYRHTKKVRRLDEKKIKYLTTIYKEVPERDDDMYFIAQEGDRCDSLAYRFYKNSNLWWFIARINNLKTMNVPAGTSLRIPLTAEDAVGF
mgnify:CR=1 FL=1